MSGFTVHRKVYIQGGSYLIAIPKLWAEANGLAGGSEVEVHLIVGDHSGEGFDDAPELDQRPGHLGYLALGDCPSMPWISQSNARTSFRVIVLPAATREAPLWSLSGPRKI